MWVVVLYVLVLLGFKGLLDSAEATISFNLSPDFGLLFSALRQEMGQAWHSLAKNRRDPKFWT